MLFVIFQQMFTHIHIQRLLGRIKSLHCCGVIRIGVSLLRMRLANMCDFSYASALLLPRLKFIVRLATCY
jgi:hypothetical protein